MEDTDNIQIIKLGAWKVYILARSQLDSLKVFDRTKLNELLADFPLVLRFFCEIWELGPPQFIIFILASAWKGMEHSLSLIFASHVIEAVQRRFNNGDSENVAVIRAVIFHILFLFFTTVISKIRRKSESIVSTRVTHHFSVVALQARLNMDVASAEDKQFQSKLNSLRTEFDIWPIQDAFETCSALIDFFFESIGLLSQTFLAYTAMRKYLTPTTIIVMCLVGPLATFTNNRFLFTHNCVAVVENDDYLRLSALHRIAEDPSYRLDILSDGIGPRIIEELRQARTRMGDICTQPLQNQWEARHSLIKTFLFDVFPELPTLFIALRYVLHPEGFTFGSFTILQRAVSNIRHRIEYMAVRIRYLPSNLLTIRSIHSLRKFTGALTDGNLPYPTSEGEKSNGARIEFRDVVYTYPNASKNALDKVSFTIMPGQLVVIVGVNGSGKSSIIKLLNRILDPTHGQILLDDVPLRDFRMHDIRKAMAILRQDHTLYPLSLRENIELGLPYEDVMTEDIETAARDGGSYGFIQKLDEKLDTVLFPCQKVYVTDHGSASLELKDIEKKVTKRTSDVSGGERQRLSASRTFLRLKSPDIRVLVADEPTSALDPEGEYEMFTRFREECKGKTAIFITHRFGHLTKHADLILCMKEGTIVEQGRHEDLIVSGGEYSRLYNVQAKAFL